MPRYNLPDGRYVDVPADADRDYYIRLQNTLAQEYPDNFTQYQEPTETTLGGNVLEVAKGIPRGLGQGLLSGLEGVVNIFDVGNDSAIGDSLRNAQDFIGELELLKPAKGYEDKFSTQFGQGLGSFGSFLIPGTAVGKLTGLAGKASQLQRLAKTQGGTQLTKTLKELEEVSTRLNRARRNATLGFAVPTGISEQGSRIERAELEGESVNPTQEIFSEIFGGAVGATEIFAPTRLLKSLTKSDGQKLNVIDRLKSAAATGGVEGLQEGVAEIMQDAIAANMYNENLKIGESFLDSAMTGGAVGATADLVLRGFMGKNKIGQSIDVEQELDSRKIMGDAREQERQQAKDINFEATPIVQDKPPVAEEVLDDTTPEPKQELPVLEEVQVVQNEDGSSSVVGVDSGIVYETSRVLIPKVQIENRPPPPEEVDVLGSLEEASNKALEVQETLRTNYINNIAVQIAGINGFSESGSMKRLLQILYDPKRNILDARRVALLDSVVSGERRRQIKDFERIQELEKSVNTLELIDALTRGDGNLEARERLESEINLLKPVYKLDEIPAEYQDKKKSKTQLKKELTREFGAEKANELIKRYENGEIVSPLQEALLSEENSSLLNDFQNRADKKGFGKKSYYTIDEVKRILKPADFNQLMRDRANILFELDAQYGLLNEVGRREDNTIDVSPAAFKQILAAKNIKGNITGPEFEFIRKTITGEAKFSKMNLGQKEMLMTRLGALPRFDSPTSIPDLMPRQYTEQQLNAFANQYQNSAITDREIQTYFDSQNLVNTKTQRDKFKKDLLFSKRAIKKGNRVLGNPNYKLEQSKNATPDNETQGEYIERLEQTQLTPEEVDKLVFGPPKPVLTLPPPITLESYDTLAKALDRRLRKLGLSKDVRIKITDYYKGMQNAVRDDNGNVIGFKEGTEKPDAEYNKAHKTMLFYMASINPGGMPFGGMPALEEKMVQDLNHEVIHAMRNLGLFTEGEYQQLVKEAKAALPQDVQKKIKKNYVDELKLPPYAVDEEFVAEFFRVYTKDPSSLNRTQRTRVQRFFDFIREMFNGIYISDFRNPYKILEDIEAGVIGRRDRNKIRSANDSMILINQLVGAGASLNTPQATGDTDGEREQPIKVALKDVIDEPKAFKLDRDNSTGHVADLVAPQYGPPADNLNENTSDKEFYQGLLGQYGTFGVSGNLYDPNEFQIYSVYRNRFGQINKYVEENGMESLVNPQTDEAIYIKDSLQLLAEEQQFFQALQEAQGNPNARITVYQAAPQRDLREGDLVTPLRTEAVQLVKDSQITRQQIREAERERLRQQDIERTGAIDLTAERLRNQADEFIDRDLMGIIMSSKTPSKLHEYTIRARELRWDGNGGWGRWGFFPEKIVDLPTFNRKVSPQKSVDFKDKGGLNEKIEATVDLNGVSTDIVLSKTGQSTETNPSFAADLIFDRTYELYEVYAKPSNEIRDILFSNPVHNALLGFKQFGFFNEKLGEKLTFNYNTPLVLVAKEINDSLNISPDDPAYLRPSPPADLVGGVSIGRDEDGNITHLENIFIDQNQQGNGIAKAILETIMSTNPNIVDGKEKLNIINITPSALDFWQNLGTGFIADKYGDIELTSGRLGFSDVVYSKPTAELDSAKEETLAQEQAKIKEAKDFIEKENEQTYSEAVPRFNNKASDLAQKVAYEIEQENDESYKDLPTFRIDKQPVPKEHEKIVDDALGQIEDAPLSFWERVSEGTVFGNPSRWLTSLRAAIIDKYNKELQGIKKNVAANPDLENIERFAETGAYQAMLWTDKAKGIFASVIKDGFMTMKNGLASVEIDGRLNFINAFGRLYDLAQKESIDAEKLFGTYGVGIRSKTILDKNQYDENGKLVKGQPIPLQVNKEDGEIDLDATVAKIEQALAIGNEYKEVKEAWDIFTEINAKTIQFGIDTGMISDLAPIPEIRKALLDNGIESAKDASDAKLLLLAEQFNSVKGLQPENIIETRSTAQIWKDDASYYPFYRAMVNEAESKVNAPNIGGGILGGNPLAIPMRGKQEAVNVRPIEAILRNQLAILTAGMRNDAAQKLMRNHLLSRVDNADGDLELGAREVPSDKAQGIDIIPVFVDGRKKFFQVADPYYFEGLRTLGIQDDLGVISTFLGMPATLLRETVTRDPGFILINMLRDTMSASVTSGSRITPVIDTFRNFQLFGATDLRELERFGVLGGYDYSADSVDAVRFFDKKVKEAGFGENGSLNPKDAMIKVWDYLGRKTYESDGATRLGVYKKVLEATGSHTEAAFQASEIINFSRRGGHPIMSIITTAIPFLNARIQGLDVLYRSMTGKYSAGSPGAAVTSDNQIRNNIIKGFALRGGLLAMATLLYYAMVSDKDEYRARRREERDDNWFIFSSEGLPPLKIPVPFEVGVLFKTLPERIADVLMGQSSLEDLSRTSSRALTQTFMVDIFGFQAIKPFYEAYINNRSGFTGNRVVPDYIERSLEPRLQATPQTNEFIRLIGQGLNISPMKLEYALSGYGGTIGTYILSLIDAVTRGVTGKDIVTPTIDRLPLLKRIFASEVGAGVQQQFYELREESNRAIATINELKERGMFKEVQTFRANNEGLIETRPQVLRIDRYMKRYRDRRDAIKRDETISDEVKKELLMQLDLARNARLSKVPYLRTKIETFINQ